MKIKRFEEIKAWQEARVLTKALYQTVNNNKTFWNDYKFREQITNASVSIMSNIAEDFSRRTKKEFVQFLFIAKGSCAEVQSQLYVALDLAYISDIFISYIISYNFLTRMFNFLSFYRALVLWLVFPPLP